MVKKRALKFWERRSLVVVSVLVLRSVAQVVDPVRVACRGVMHSGRCSW